MAGMSALAVRLLACWRKVRNDDAEGKSLQREHVLPLVGGAHYQTGWTRVLWIGLALSYALHSTARIALLQRSKACGYKRDDTMLVMQRMWRMCCIGRRHLNMPSPMPCCAMCVIQPTAACLSCGAKPVLTVLQTVLPEAMHCTVM